MWDSVSNSEKNYKRVPCLEYFVLTRQDIIVCVSRKKKHDAQVVVVNDLHTAVLDPGFTGRGWWTPIPKVGAPTFYFANLFSRNL